MEPHPHLTSLKSHHSHTLPSHSTSIPFIHSNFIWSQFCLSFPSMPGTIQVTVLDFNGPSSSSPPSTLTLKVSMGKREYQTGDNGDFSFPLTSLRENLVILLQDANGNQISHTGIATIRIIEKGLLDDLFHLEGGGNVHMRLQFFLTKEERDRIRIVRESAVKKKSGAITFGRSQSLSSINDEVSDSQAIVVPNAVETTGDLVAQSSKEKEGTDRVLSTPNATDVSEETPSTSLVKKLDTLFPSASISLQKSSSTTSLSQSVFPSIKQNQLNIVKKAGPVEKFSANGNKLLQRIEEQNTVEAGPTMQKEASPVLGFSKSVITAKSISVFLKMENSPSNKPKKRVSLEKTRSSVKKMISAFESGPKDTRSTPIEPLAEKSQLNKDAIKIPLKDQDLKDYTFPSGPSSKVLGNPCSQEDLPHPEPTTQLKESTTPYEVKEDDSESSLEETINEEQLKSPEELSESSTIETVTPLLQRSDDQDFCETSEESGTSCSNDSHDMNTLRAGKGNLESISSSENKDNLYEYCSTLLFANDMRPLCLTTGGKDVVDLLEGLCSERKSTSEGNDLLSIPEDEEKCGAEVEVKSGKKAHILRKSKSESSGDDSSNGPLGQVIKIAVIVGFGLLVLLTRQDKSSRKSKKRGNDRFFATPYRRDHESLADEEWD